MNKRWIAAAAAAALALPGLGCVGIDVHKPVWPWQEADTTGGIAQLSALWADGLVMQADPAQGGKVMPGFAGRVYFFNQEMSETRTACGELVISLYDNTQSGQPDPQPKEVWHLDGASLAKVQKKDALGFGYNIWLPWSTVGGDVNTVTLVAEYRDPSGQKLWSAPTTFPVKTGAGWQHPSSMQVTKRSTGK